MFFTLLLHVSNFVSIVGAALRCSQGSNEPPDNTNLHPFTFKPGPCYLKPSLNSEKTKTKKKSNRKFRSLISEIQSP